MFSLLEQRSLVVICGELQSFGAERSYLVSEVVSDRKGKTEKLNAGAAVLIKWDRRVTGRSCPMLRMTLEKTETETETWADSEKGEIFELVIVQKGRQR